jgi:minor histocompatibility antigen H13
MMQGDVSDSEDDDNEATESLSSEDALMFPIMGSATLFGLYLLFRFLSKEYVNMLLTVYFAAIGAAAMTQSVSTVIRWIPGLVDAGWNQKYSFKLIHRKTDKRGAPILILVRVLTTLQRR